MGPLTVSINTLVIRDSELWTTVSLSARFLRYKIAVPPYGLPTSMLLQSRSTVSCERLRRLHDKPTPDSDYCTILLAIRFYRPKSVHRHVQSMLCGVSGGADLYPGVVGSGRTVHGRWWEWNVRQQFTDVRASGEPHPKSGKSYRIGPATNESYSSGNVQAVTCLSSHV